MARLPALIIAAVSLLAAAPPPATGTLTIEVSNVRVAKGRVHVDVCPEARFLKEDCPFAATAVARKGVTVVTVSGLPAGRYAIQSFLDENSNGKMDFGLFGKLPKEGFGFSNNPKVRFAAPKFADSAFNFSGGDQKVEVRLQYVL